MSEIIMPRLSDSMEEGTILKWLKADGENVARGEPLAEIETDKATLTYESDADGVLTIVAPAGETLPIGSVIARLDAANGASGPAEPAPTAQEKSQPEPEPETTATPSTAASVAPPQAPALGIAPSTGRVKASPVARRLAREHGVDLHLVTGTGPGGRIVKDDVEQAAKSPRPATTAESPAAEAPPAATAPAPAPQSVEPTATPPPPPPSTVSETGTAKGDVTVQDLTRIQGLIARRMAESRATIPSFELHTEIDMEACVALREELKALSGNEPAGRTGRAGANPSYNDMVVKACALALREYPRANGSYRDARFELYGRVNVGVAVAGADSLVVPTVFDADRKTLREIARDTHALAERVRAGAITPPELSGGTFTVSNLGMYGVTDFTAVINPPQAAILAVGALAPRAVVGDDGRLVARHTMKVTLACDHRILYGAQAAEFLARVRELLERPLALAF
ncbi:MAG TPA: dihydrolipoamide acetyltransferase family protein [Solirubrobacteraceae bacterium]|nr:dihydrolipoamide acetyltransferase family protein [Solirubrobacteraceae bacterium]